MCIGRRKRDEPIRGSVVVEVIVVVPNEEHGNRPAHRAVKRRDLLAGRLEQEILVARAEHRLRSVERTRERNAGRARAERTRHRRQQVPVDMIPVGDDAHAGFSATARSSEGAPNGERLRNVVRQQRVVPARAREEHDSHVIDVAARGQEMSRWSTAQRGTGPGRTAAPDGRRGPARDPGYRTARRTRGSPFSHR